MANRLCRIIMMLSRFHIYMKRLLGSMVCNRNRFSFERKRLFCFWSLSCATSKNISDLNASFFFTIFWMSMLVFFLSMSVKVLVFSKLEARSPMSSFCLVLVLSKSLNYGSARKLVTFVACMIF